MLHHAIAKSGHAGRQADVFVRAQMSTAGPVPRLERKLNVVVLCRLCGITEDLRPILADDRS